MADFKMNWVVGSRMWVGLNLCRGNRSRDRQFQRAAQKMTLLLFILLVLGLYWENGKENGHYYSILGYISLHSSRVTLGFGGPSS